MKHHVKRLMPTPESMRRNRWLRWIGPALHHPRLWHMSRRGIALGMAIGVFFGLLIPIAQIPLSVGAAVVLRANVPTAAVSTLVSNPATYGPLYYAAWRLGKAVLGEPVAEETPPSSTGPRPPPDNGRGWFAKTWDGITALGKPLLLGMALMASGVGLLTYATASVLLAMNVRWQRRRRLRQRATASAVAPPRR
jgi:uncharacterized protein (DUF2062 family)